MNKESEQFWEKMKKEAEIRRNEEYRNAFNNPFYALQNVGFQNQSGLAAVMTEEQMARDKAQLDRTRQLKGSFRDYICDIDVSSPCERLPDDYQAFLDTDRPKYVQPGGIDVASFREWCEAVDRDFKWQEETEKRLF